MQAGTGKRYLNLYTLQAEGGEYQAMKPAVVYGMFDRAGAHEVDFSPLEQAIGWELPPNSTYTSRCWALHPERIELRSGVQARGAACRACGMLGEVYIAYRVEHGAAIPVSVDLSLRGSVRFRATPRIT